MKPGEKWSSLIIIHTHKKYRFCWNSPKKKDRLWKLARGNWFQRFFKKHPNQNIPAWHGKHSVPPIWLVAVPFGHFMHIVEEVVLVENTVGFSCSAFRGVCSKMFHASSTSTVYIMHTSRKKTDFLWKETYLVGRNRCSQIKGVWLVDNAESQ